MKRSGARPVALLLATTLTTGMLIALSFASGAQPAEAQVYRRLWPRGCRADITAALSADSIRLCEQTDVSVTFDPACEVCPGGINVVFMQVTQTARAEWQNQEAVRGLAQLEADYGGPIRAAVVHYDKARATTIVTMTEDLDRVRAALLTPIEREDEKSLAYGPAKDEALAQIRLARPKSEHGDSVEQCELIVWFSRGALILPVPG